MLLLISKVLIFHLRRAILDSGIGRDPTTEIQSGISGISQELLSSSTSSQVQNRKTIGPELMLQAERQAIMTCESPGNLQAVKLSVEMTASPHDMSTEIQSYLARS